MRRRYVLQRRRTRWLTRWRGWGWCFYGVEVDVVGRIFDGRGGYVGV
jgi:hypothetical protein